MNSEVAWVLVSSGTQFQPQIIHDPDKLPDYLFVSYDYDLNFSVETKIKPLFLISYFNLSKKRNGTSGTQI